MMRVARSPADPSRLVAFTGTCFLLVAAPFEGLHPLFEFRWQNITTIEAAIGLACGAWGAALLVSGRRPLWRTAVTAPWVIWLVVAALAALAAPAFRGNALKTVGRLGAGLIVLLLPLNGVTTSRRLATAICLAAAGGVVVAVLATLEYLGEPAVLRWLDAFREGVRVVGGQVRASGPLQYPTIASMYLEIVFALTLGILLAAFEERSPLRVILAFAALTIIAEGVVVTLTRAGLITLGATLGLVGAWRYVARGVDRALGGLALLAVVVIALVFSSASAETLRLRLTTEGQAGWYRAAFVAPAALSFGAGSLNVVEVAITNQGRLSWSSDAQPPFYVSYHWLDEDMRRVVMYDGLRTRLPRTLAPNDTIRVRLPVRAPRRTGRYRLGWDVVQEGRLWFSTEPGAKLTASAVTVSGVAAGGTSSDASWTPLPPQAVRIGRPRLWRIALQLFAAHPLLGVGPDNFRLSYAAYTGASRADPRVTSNNTYLEVLTGTGAVGFAAFAWLLWRAQRTIRRTRAGLAEPARSLYAGVAAAAFAIALHGVVDSFLTLTPTYLLMALTIGLSMAPAAWGTGAWRSVGRTREPGPPDVRMPRSVDAGIDRCHSLSIPGI